MSFERPFEKPKFNPAGNLEKMKEAEERAKAIQDGRLPEWEAEKRVVINGNPKPPVTQKRDFRAGDPAKLKAAQDRLKKLFPQQPGGAGERKEAA